MENPSVKCNVCEQMFDPWITPNEMRVVPTVVIDPLTKTPTHTHKTIWKHKTCVKPRISL